MKVENPIILSHYILMFVLAPCLAVSQTHFTFHSPTDNNATVAITTSSNPNILGQPLEDGDEIGVFTPDGLCAGAVVWHLANTALTVWGDDSLTPETDGFKVGEELDFRIWDKSEDKEYEDVNFAFSSGPSTYQVNGISVLQFMTAVPVELVSLDAKVSGNQVTLYWVTATETNNYGFEIERSQDRIKFTKLGFLEGKETTSVPQSYSF